MGAIISDLGLFLIIRNGAAIDYDLLIVGIALFLIGLILRSKN